VEFGMPIAIEELADGITKVVLSGVIDIAGSAEIDEPMQRVGESGNAVIVDLSGVEFIDSLGLRCLVLCGKSVMRRRGVLVLLAPQPAVKKVITVSNIHALFPIHKNQAAAIAAVTPSLA